ncbi:hypothetical protein A9976_04940 [Delftia sp. UME58]|nr:hypothetical protein [Delftia sp. UME58]
MDFLISIVFSQESMLLPGHKTHLKKASTFLSSHFFRPFVRSSMLKPKMMIEQSSIFFVAAAQLLQPMV